MPRNDETILPDDDAEKDSSPTPIEPARREPHIDRSTASQDDAKAGPVEFSIASTFGETTAVPQFNPSLDETMMPGASVPSLAETQPPSRINVDANEDETLARMTDLSGEAAEAHFDFHRQLRTLADEQPKQIGRYHILSTLGQGGMGCVYKAEQRVPVKRLVALKVIRIGMNSREVMARFDSERQALARMDHPGVARILDGGTSEDGQPYFVMEYVNGRPITDFADQHKLNIEQRLELFIAACEAIAHAHGKALLHRDIKAGNVLAYEADGKFHIKVIDFGIAKAVGEEKLNDITITNAAGAIMGTPYAMSPEQADGSTDIDTRTDVYALGVLLYELLIGRMPLGNEDFAGKTLSGVVEVVRKKEPLHPSTRLKQMPPAEAEEIAALRDTRAAMLMRTLKNELAWIPLKALRKDRERRYVSVQELADDVRNYLDGRPLIAGPESKVYRSRKFVARNKVGVTLGLAVVVLAVVGNTTYLVKLKGERDRTQTALATSDRNWQTAQGVIEFLSKVFDFANPRSGHADAKVKDAVEFAVLANQTKALNGDQVVRGGIEVAIGTILRDVGKSSSAETMLRSAIQNFESDHRTSNDQLAKGYVELARTLLAEYSADDAIAQLERAIPLLKAKGPTLELARAQNYLGIAFLNKPLLKEANQQFEQALTTARLLPKVDNALIGEILNSMGGLAEQTGDYPKAIELWKQSLSAREKALSPDDWNVAETLNNLGSVYVRSGEVAVGVPLLAQALKIYQSRASDQHPFALKCRSTYASALRRQGELDESAKQYRIAIQGFSKQLPEQAIALANAQSGLGQTLIDMPGNDKEAEESLLAAYQFRIKDGDPGLGRTADALKKLYARQGRRGEIDYIDREIALQEQQRLPATMSSK